MIRTDNWRRDGCSEAARAMGDSLNEPTLMARIPELHGAGRARKSAGFANAKKKANNYKRVAPVAAAVAAVMIDQ